MGLITNRFRFNHLYLIFFLSLLVRDGNDQKLSILYKTYNLIYLNDKLNVFHQSLLINLLSDPPPYPLLRERKGSHTQEQTISQMWQQGV